MAGIWQGKKKISPEYVQRKEDRRRLTISALLIFFVIGIAGGIYTSRHRVANLFKPKELDIKNQSVGFKERPGSWGTQGYTASVQRTAYVGGRGVTPKTPCSDMLVITLKPSLKTKDVEELKKLFTSVDEAVTVDVSATKMIVNRTCDELHDVEQLWSLDDAWNIVEPILSEHFNPKKK